VSLFRNYGADVDIGTIAKGKTDSVQKSTDIYIESLISQRRGAMFMPLAWMGGGMKQNWGISEGYDGS